MSSLIHTGYPGKKAFMTATVSHIAHVLSDGRVVYPGDTITVKHLHDENISHTGTADIGFDYCTDRTYLIFVDKYGNTHCPTDDRVV